LTPGKAPGPGRRYDRRIPVLLVALVAAVFTTFWPVSRNGFINFDDNVIIFRNADVQQGLTVATLRRAFAASDDWNWIPVTRIGHLLNGQLFGLRPGPHHLMSVFYHALAAALLFLSLHRMTGRLWLALFVAALFALHPQRVESVAWAAELKDPLSGCFFSLTLLTYLNHAARPSAARRLAFTGVFCLGLMAKPTLLPLPFLLLLLDYWPLGRLDRRAFVEKIPLLLLTAAVSAVTYATQFNARAVNTLAVISLRARIGNALTAVAAYLGSFLWPMNLAVIYPHRGEDFSPGLASAGAALLLVITGIAAHQLRRRPWLAVGWFWYLGLLVPVLGLVQVGIQSRADRYTYLPLIGIALALGWVIAELGATLRRRALPAAAAGLILIAFAGVSRRTAGFWQDDAALFGHAVAVTRDNGPALTHLGAARSAAGRPDEAVALLRQAIAIFPAYAFSHYALGNALSLLDQDAAAIPCYRRALRLYPGWAEAHNNLGASLAATGRFDEAALHFKAALAAQREMPAAADNLRRVTPLLRR